MRLAILMFATALLVVGASFWLESNDAVLARLKFARRVEKLRPLVASPRFDVTPDADTIACMNRLTELDEELDRLAPFSENAGAGMTWRPAHRAELFAMARNVEPVLDAMAQLAAERKGLGPLPRSPGLGTTRHRANLFCVAALVEPDDERARARFEQAFDLAQLEDDGGWWAVGTQLSSASIICQAARQRAGRHGRDAGLARSLSARFEAAFQCRLELERTARDFVRVVDRPAGREIFIEEFKRWTLEASLLYPVLKGELDPASVREQAQTQGLQFLGLTLCNPEHVASRERYLRL